MSRVVYVGMDIEEAKIVAAKLDDGGGRRAAGLKPEDLAGWETPIVPLAK